MINERFEITRQQYEELKANPRNGWVVDMECKYWLSHRAPVSEPTGKLITGPYEGIRRSPLATIHLMQTALKRGYNVGGVDVLSLTKVALSSKDAVTSQKLAARVAEALKIPVTTGSKHVTQMINLKLIGFKQPQYG